VTYDDLQYWLFYDTQAENRPHGHVTFLKADKVGSSGNPYLVRYHLVGTFDFVAAHAPSPSGVCLQEALAYLQAHPNDPERHPEYNARFCEAKKIAVKGSFDIIQDLPADLVE
jgi:hypothetical protein